MDYEKPEVIDFGNLVELTQSSGVVGTPDGVGFSLKGNIGDTNFSIGILP